MKTSYVFNWDEETRTATCTIDDPRRGVFVGIATCHPDDADMCSKLTGQEIALNRASIKLLVYVRDSEIKPGLQALKNYLYSINKSKEFNKKHYATKILYHNIKQYEEELSFTNELIEKHREALRSFIDEHEKFFQSVRRRREGKK